MAQSDNVQSKSDLVARITALSADDLRDVQLWLLLTPTGSAKAQRDRLGGGLTGPAKRHRAGWLQLALDCVADGQNDDCEVPGVDFLFEFKERLDSIGLLPSWLPLSLLPDLARTVTSPDGGDDYVQYSLAPGFAYPSISAVNSLVGHTTDEFEELKTEIERIKSTASFATSVQDSDELVARVRDTLAHDVAEERFAIGNGSSVALQRRTLAFDFNPDQFLLYNYGLHESGRGRDLVPGTVDQAWMRDQLLNSGIGPLDLKKMERRSLVPESLWTQAYHRNAAKTLIMGGKDSVAFKQDENLRIQQQAILKKTQHCVHFVAAASRAHSSLETVLFSAGPGGTMPMSHADDQNFDYEESDIFYAEGSDEALVKISGNDVLSSHELANLRVSRDAMEEALFAASDSFHIFAAELSELERKRDDEYVRARCGNPAYVGKRPTSDVTVYDKDMSALDNIADKELLRQKNLQALKGQDFRKKHPKKTPRGGKGDQGRGHQSKSQRNEQSRKDRATAAKKRSERTPEKAGKEPRTPQKAVEVSTLKDKRK